MRIPTFPSLFAVGLISVTALVTPAFAATVGALGQIQPLGGVITIQGTGDGYVQAFLVERGTEVVAGQSLAQCSGVERVQADLALAQLRAQDTKIQTQLAAELDAASAQNAQSDLDFAAERLRRYLQLDGTSISAQETAGREYQLARAKLAVHTGQLQARRQAAAAKVQLAQADAQVDNLKQQLAALTIKAPADGLVIDVLTAIGSPARNGLFHFANIAQMLVTCDVFEGDLTKLKPGQKVTVSSSSLPQKLSGTVKSVGRNVSARSKTASVHIDLDDDALASHFIGMEVQVTIDL